MSDERPNFVFELSPAGNARMEEGLRRLAAVLPAGCQVRVLIRVIPAGDIPAEVDARKLLKRAKRECGLIAKWAAEKP